MALGSGAGVIGSNQLTNPRVVCATGHFCPEGTASPRANPCAPGTYSPDTDNSKQEECLVCPAGRYCTGGGAIPSGWCADGYYCPTGSSTAQAVPCPAGTFFSSAVHDNGALRGARAVTDCRVCPLGNYCPLASAAARPCPAGSYGREPGLQAAAPSGSVTGCAACPAGWKCPASGLIDPVECGLGTYSAAGASSCSPCALDHYCD